LYLAVVLLLLIYCVALVYALSAIEQEYHYIADIIVTTGIIYCWITITAYGFKTLHL